MPRASPVPSSRTRSRLGRFRAAYVELLLISLPWAWAVLQWGGVRPHDRLVWFSLLGAGVLLCRVAGPSDSEPAPAGRLLWALFALIGLAGLQLVPLPLSLLASLSPARAEAARAVPGDTADWAPLSIVPAETLDSFVLLLGATLVGLVVRGIAIRLSLRGWQVAVPVIIVGAMEGLLGPLQQATHFSPTGGRGTYINHNHYAGLLEMALPLSCAVAMIGIRRAGRAPDSRLLFGACAAAVGAGLVVAGLISSFSRVGFASAVAGLSVFLLSATRPTAGQGKRVAAAAVIVLLCGSSFLLLPDGFVERYADVLTVDDFLSEGRVELWRETLHLVSAYPWFGSGLGAYSSAFWEFKRSWPHVTDDHAHSDYLETLAEFGILGMAAALLLIGLVFIGAVRLSGRGTVEETRLTAAACAGAITAVALHSVADFNLAIPANAILFAWILGLAAGLGRRET